MQFGEDRSTFIELIRGALRRESEGPPEEPAPSVDESLVRLAEPASDLVELFSENAQAIGFEVQRTTVEAFPQTLRKLFESFNQPFVGVAVDDTTAHQLQVRETLRNMRLKLREQPGDPDMTNEFDLDIGITDVHAALAESGTLICEADALHPRSLSLAPPRHVAIVRRSDIHPDMIDFWTHKRTGGERIRSSITFITGPSKTADIEGELVTGVHGPGKVYTLVVENA